MHKLRNRKSYKRNQSIAIICIALMFIVVGFALISTTLAITSNSTIGKVTFDVHFENLNIKEGSMTAKIPATINTDDKTKISFSLDLKDPGSYYEFTADIVNKGTLDAKVNLVKIDGLTDEQRKYIKVSYKYIYGTEILVNDLFKSGAKEAIKVRVEFLKNINAEDLPSTDESLNLTFETEFIQDDGTGIERDKSAIKVNILGQDMDAYLDNVKSKYVTTVNGVNFNHEATNQNGKGIYLRAGTEEDSNPIFYFRGEVDNNHVLFGGFCWKIVRTTEQGGTKLIYDGIPTENNCNNVGINTQLSETSRFNNQFNSLADIGYMYGNRYAYTSWTDLEYVYGSDVEYSNGAYTLKDTLSGIVGDIKNKHYTCKLTTDGTCNTVYYVYLFNDGKAYSIALTGGKKLENIISESFENINDSAIKKTIDDWFKDNLLSQEDKLEDAVWCNDRSISSGGYIKDADFTNQTIFGTSIRNLTSSSLTPELKDSKACPNQNDRFTKDDTTNGNGALIYPVGLLTADEATVAGHGWIGYSSTSYLANNQYYWLLSPHTAGESGFRDYGFLMLPSGNFGSNVISLPYGVRPSIVLKKDIVATRGNGTATNPYVVE